jgi:hypothetical protein
VVRTELYPFRGYEGANGGALLLAARRLQKFCWSRCSLLTGNKWRPIEETRKRAEFEPPNGVGLPTGPFALQSFRVHFLVDKSMSSNANCAGLAMWMINARLTWTGSFVLRSPLSRSNSVGAGCAGALAHGHVVPITSTTTAVYRSLIMVGCLRPTKKALRRRATMGENLISEQRQLGEGFAKSRLARESEPVLEYAGVDAPEIDRHLEVAVQQIEQLGRLSQ